MAITRLNNNSVTSVSALPNLASLPSGIDTGKVVQHITSTGGSGNTSSTSYVASGLKATITPTSASNKVFVIFNFHIFSRYAGSNRADGSCLSYGKIVRDIGGATTDLANDMRVNGGSGYLTDAYEYGHHENRAYIGYVDSPNTTSATEYEVYLKFSEGLTTGGSHTWNSGWNNFCSLMEIAS